MPTNFSDNRKTRRGGFYWIDEKPYVTVTTVLQAIAKPALLNWYGKMVYAEMVKDPGIDEKTALAAPMNASNKAKERGTTVHSGVEAFIKSGNKIETAREEIQGYLNSFYDWFENEGVKKVGQEFSVVSHKYGYAGTVDLHVKIGNKNMLVDVKTGKYIYPEAFLQLSAYKQALEEMGTPVDGIAVILLGEKGTYKFEYGEPRLDVFLAVKKLWEWQNRDFCQQVGYKINY